MDYIKILRSAQNSTSQDVADALSEMEGIHGPGFMNYIECMSAIAAHALSCASVALASDQLSGDDAQDELDREMMTSIVADIAANATRVSALLHRIGSPDSVDRTWEVTVSRLSHRHATVVVQAASESAARVLALDQAGDADFGPEHDCEYEAINAKERT